MADYTIFYKCSEGGSTYYASGEYDWGVYYCGNDGNYYYVYSYSDEPYGSAISNLSYCGSECPRYTIFYRCDGAGPYYIDNILSSGVYSNIQDGWYYRVDHYSYNPEGSWLGESWQLLYSGLDCPSYSYTIFYACSDNSGPYYVYGTNYSGVYYYSGYGYYRVDHYSYVPEGTYLDASYLSYYGQECPTYTIFYRCEDNAGPYYVNSINFIPGVYSYTDGQYYRVDHYSNSAEGSPLSESGLSYYGLYCPSYSYTIFYRCGDNAGPFYTDGIDYSGVYYYSFDGQYYRVDHYSYTPEGDYISFVYLSYYGANCPGGPSFNPAWALYTNTHIL